MKKFEYIKLLKSICLLIISLVLSSCNSEDKKVKNDQIKEIGKLEFYKCDYLKKHDTLLSSGSKDSITEIWGFNKLDINSLPQKNLNNTDLNQIIENAKQHLSNRFPGIILNFSDLKLKKIDIKDTSSLKNDFYIVSFIYDKRGYYQEVPVLPDGRIILSNNE
jgi:hypothetical protein